jgi:mycofactocin precursor
MINNQDIANAAPEVIVADPEPPRRPQPTPIESELLIEDVSIDGMCGIY